MKEKNIYPKVKRLSEQCPVEKIESGTGNLNVKNLNQNDRR